MIDFKAAYAGITFAKEALKFTLDQKVDDKVREKIGEALEKIGKVQDDLFQVREDLLRLQEENHQLLEEKREKENWDSRMSVYVLVKTAGASTLYESKTEPKHYICPACVEKKQIQILQNTSTKEISLFCPSCKTQYNGKPRERAIGVGAGRHW
jgi:hypothetical protein